MYTYHLKNILECNDYSNDVVLAKLKAWGCKYIDSLDPLEKGFVTGWREQLVPNYVAHDYHKFIARLDDGFEYEYKGEIYRPTSRVQRSGRIYTTMDSGSKRLNFQSLKASERDEFQWKSIRLASFDISASQLRIALALRGEVLPWLSSPWDNLEVDHPVMDVLPAEMARELKKTVALLLIRGERKFSYKRIWVKKIEAPDDEMPSMKGLQDAVVKALLHTYPVIDSELKDLDATPDGYVVSHKSKTFRRHDIQCRPLGIKTSFMHYESEPPTVGNKLEAMEAFVLREVVRGLPPEAPVLTCHDQIYVPAELIGHVEAAIQTTIASLACS